MFNVLIEERVISDLKHIDFSQKNKILSKVNDILSQNPYPKASNPKKLKGTNSYRLRIGNYRAIYVIQDKNICVFSIKHRKDAYKH